MKSLEKLLKEKTKISKHWIYLNSYNGINVGDTIKTTSKSNRNIKGIVVEIEKAKNIKKYPNLVSFFVIKNGNFDKLLAVLRPKEIEKIDDNLPLSIKGQLTFENKMTIIKKIFYR